MPSDRKTLIVVSVGTDHHRFDRLVDWLDEWGGSPEHALFRVQHGTSRPLDGAHNVPLLPHHEILQWMREADAVVLQGGPGGMFDAMKCGHRPIVVPRQSSFGEHVDDHQVAFSGRMAARGLVQVPSSSSDLSAMLNSVRPGEHRTVDLTEGLAALGPQTVADRFQDVPLKTLGARGGGRRVRQLLQAKRTLPAPRSPEDANELVFDMPRGR